MSTKSKKDKRTSRRKTRVDKTSTDGKRTRAGSKSRKRSKTDGKRHTVHTKHTIKLKSQKSTVYSLDTPRRQNVSPKTSKTPKASKHSVSKSSSRHHRQRSKSVSGAQIKSLSKRPKSARNRKSVEKVPDFESQTSGESESLATTESLFSAPVSNLSISMDVEEVRCAVSIYMFSVICSLFSIFLFLRNLIRNIYYKYALNWFLRTFLPQKPRRRRALNATKNRK